MSKCEKGCLGSLAIEGISLEAMTGDRASQMKRLNGPTWKAGYVEYGCMREIENIDITTVIPFSS